MKTRAPVLRAIHDAKQSGKSCRPIAEESIRELLAMTIDEARSHLGIGPVKWYQKCQDIWEEEGIDPLKILADDAKTSVYREDPVPSPEDLSKGPSVFTMQEQPAQEKTQESQDRHERA